MYKQLTSVLPKLPKNLKKRIVEENKTNGRDEIFSEKVKAGKRTYFFDVKSTRSNDYYLTITESKKRYNKDDEGFTYEKHKIFLYKEDFNKFLKALTEAVDYVKTELMPDFDFDAYNHDTVNENEGGGLQEGASHIADDIIEEVRHTPAHTAAASPNSAPAAGEEVDKW